MTLINHNKSSIYIFKISLQISKQTRLLDRASNNGALGTTVIPVKEVGFDILVIKSMLSNDMRSLNDTSCGPLIFLSRTGPQAYCQGCGSVSIAFHFGCILDL